MTSQAQPLVATDKKPFFEKAIKYAAQYQLIDQIKINEIINDAATGTIQIAKYFGLSPHLRANLEAAKKNMVSLVSLYLENETDGDLSKAAQLLKIKSFRSVSRGGSDLLKTLYSMPEDNYLGFSRFPESESEFLKKTLSRNLTTLNYRQIIENCKQQQHTINFAKWLINTTSTPLSTFTHMFAPADHVIRTALLAMVYGAKKPHVKSNFTNEEELFKIFVAIRKEWAFLGDVTYSKKNLSVIPEEFSAYAQETLLSIQINDIPKITDSSLSLTSIFSELKMHSYFCVQDTLHQVNRLDITLAKEWADFTGGFEDDALLLTLFLCFASNTPPKKILKTGEVKKMVLHMRENGIDALKVTQFIEKATHDEIAHLHALWEDFIEEAKPYLLDESDQNCNEVITFLTDHCKIKK